MHGSGIAHFSGILINYIGYRIATQIQEGLLFNLLEEIVVLRFQIIEVFPIYIEPNKILKIPAT